MKNEVKIETESQGSYMETEGTENILASENRIKL